MTLVVALARKSMSWTYGELEELIELVVFLGEKINYCTSTVRSVFVLEKPDLLVSKFVSASCPVPYPSLHEAAAFIIFHVMVMLARVAREPWK